MMTGKKLKIPSKRRFMKCIRPFIGIKAQSSYCLGPCTLVKEGFIKEFPLREVKKIIHKLPEMDFLNKKLIITFEEKQITINVVRNIEERELPLFEEVKGCLLRCGFGIRSDDGDRIVFVPRRLLGERNGDFKYIVDPTLLSITTFPSEIEGLLLNTYVLKHQYGMAITEDDISIRELFEPYLEEGEVFRFSNSKSIYILYTKNKKPIQYLFDMLSKFSLMPQIISYTEKYIIFRIKSIFSDYEVQVNRKRYIKYSEGGSI